MPNFEVVEPSTTIYMQHNGLDILRQIEFFGRISHRTEDRQTETSYERFISNVVLSHGDWSITEHLHVTVIAIVDRGIQQEWTRHRIGSYTVESTRFVNYAKQHTESAILANPLKFVCPKDMLQKEDLYTVWLQAREADAIEYNHYISSGIKPQIARNSLPLCTASKLVATYNLRMWRHFFLMRTTVECHPQMLEVSIPLLRTFKHNIPLLFADIQPYAKQRDNLKLPC